MKDRPMRKCGLPFDALVDYQEGKADKATLERVQTHLETGCDTCQTYLARLSRILTALPQAEMLHAPLAAQERVQNLFRERTRKPTPTPLRARLVFDSQAGLALAGARGESSQSSQLLYETDSYHVDIWQEKADDAHWYVIGQILPKTGAAPLRPEEAILIPPEGAHLTASFVGDEFHLSSVLSGVYELHLRLESAEIIVPEVFLGRKETS